MQTLNIKSFVFALLVIGLSFGFSSCQDEEEIEFNFLEAVGPIPANRGEKLEFIGKDLSKVVAVVFANGTEVTDLQFDGKQKFSIIIPNNVGAGQITLKLSNGGTYTTVTRVTFNQTMVVESFSPAKVYPGDEVTLKGLYLEDALYFSLGGDTYPLYYQNEDGEQETIVVSSSETEMVIKVPALAKGGYIGVADDLYAALAPTQLEVTMPKQTSWTCSDNPAIPGKSKVTLKGTNFELLTAIVFANGLEVKAEDFTSKSETEVVFTLPRQAGDGDVRLKSVSGATSIAGELKILAISVDGISTFNYAKLDEDKKFDSWNDATVKIMDATNKYWLDNSFTLTGANIDLVDSIYVGGVKAKLSNITSTSLDCVIPLKAQLEVLQAYGDKSGSSVINDTLAFELKIYANKGLMDICYLKAVDLKFDVEYNMSNSSNIVSLGGIEFANSVNSVTISNQAETPTAKTVSFKSAIDKQSISIATIQTFGCFQKVDMNIKFQNDFVLTQSIDVVGSTEQPSVVSASAEGKAGQTIRLEGINLDKVVAIRVQAKNIFKEEIVHKGSNLLYVTPTEDEIKAVGSYTLEVSTDGTNFTKIDWIKIKISK